MPRRLLALLMMMCFMLFFFMGQAEAEELTNDGLEIRFLDVGQGDAAILSCNDEVLMIDGGKREESSFIFAYLKNTLGIDHIDYMIATHPHEDHIGGLSAALNACTVGHVFSPVSKYESKTFGSFLKYVHKQGLELTIPEAGDMFQVGEAEVTFLSPIRDYENANDLSLVVRVVYGDTSFLFTGDAEWDAEHDMVDSGRELSADVLKVCHHGSASSSSYVFLREIMPKYAVISCGKDNSYGHPDEGVLSRLHDVGAEVYRTDLQGTIICTSNGTQITFETEKSVSMLENLNSEIKTDQDEIAYIGNKNSKKFHRASCPAVIKMKDKNRKEFKTREEAVNAGYVPCKRCKP